MEALLASARRFVESGRPAPPTPAEKR